jgi:hypothetical protein
MFKRLNLILITALTVLVCLAMPASPAFAATTNYAVDKPVVTVPIFIAGQRTATTAAVVKFTLPFKAKLIGVSATARASGGTTPTLTVDLQMGGTTVLSAPISITAGTVAEGTVATATLTDESAITVDLAITGTTPTWDDITILVTLVRL